MARTNLTTEELAMINYNNHELITDLSAKVNLMKGYEVGYGNPKNGKMIINKDGVNYLITVEPLLNYNGKSLDEVIHDFNHVLSK